MRKITLKHENTIVFTSSNFDNYDEERPLVFDLKEINYSFSQNDFNHVDFCRLWLHGYKLGTAIDTSLSKGDLPEMVTFKSVDLQNTRFDFCELLEIYFNGCNFNNAFLNNGYFDKVTFAYCNFSHIHLPATTFIECSFENVNFDTALIASSTLFKYCKFKNCQGLDRIPSDCKQNCLIIQ